MRGRLAIIAILVVALAVGAGVWWAQERGFWQRLPATEAAAAVVTLADGTRAALPVATAEAIGGTSSPLRYRACLTLAAPAPGPAAAYPGAEPLVAPGWFSCFDAGAIAADLAAGRASPVLGQADVAWGVDRVLALYPDGRAFAWNQINRCGREVFDGRPAPADCPPRPPTSE